MKTYQFPEKVSTAGHKLLCEAIIAGVRIGLHYAAWTQEDIDKATGKRADRQMIGRYPTSAMSLERAQSDKGLLEIGSLPYEVKEYLRERK